MFFFSTQNVPGTSSLTEKSVDAPRPNAAIQVHISVGLCAASSQGLLGGHYSCFHHKAKQRLICITDCSRDKVLHNNAELDES